MENASKALIIAGSVLIAILLISLGLVIFNSTRGVTGQAKDLGETLEDHTFNSQFTKYCGESVRGSQLRTLVEYIIAYNGKHTEKIKVNNSVPTSSSSIKATQHYKVTPEYGTDGRIININYN